MSKERTPAPSTERQTRAPNGSALTYGLVGFSLAVVVLLAVAGFYDINLLRHGLLIVGVTALAAVAGIVVHFKRTARYRAALESCVAS